METTGQTPPARGCCGVYFLHAKDGEPSKTNWIEHGICLYLGDQNPNAPVPLAALGHVHSHQGKAAIVENMAITVDAYSTLGIGPMLIVAQTNGSEHPTWTLRDRDPKCRLGLLEFELLEVLLMALPKHVDDWDGLRAVVQKALKFTIFVRTPQVTREVIRAAEALPVVIAEEAFASKLNKLASDLELKYAPKAASASMSSEQRVAEEAHAALARAQFRYRRIVRQIKQRRKRMADLWPKVKPKLPFAVMGELHHGAKLGLLPLPPEFSDQPFITNTGPLTDDPDCRAYAHWYIQVYIYAETMMQLAERLLLEASQRDAVAEALAGGPS